MSKSGGTLYIGVPHSKFWGTCPPAPKVYASGHTHLSLVPCTHRPLDVVYCIAAACIAVKLEIILYDRNVHLALKMA